MAAPIWAISLVRRIEPVEPGEERALQQIGNGHALERALELEMTAGVAPDILLEHGLGQFLHEQRYAVGAGNDLVEHEVRQRLAAGELLDHGLALAAGQPIEIDLHELRIASIPAGTPAAP